MSKEIGVGVVIFIFLISMVTFVPDISSGAPNGPVHIRADGTVDPSGAPVQRDGDVYTLTGNISTYTDGIIVERGDVTIDGRGYFVEGTSASYSNGFFFYANNVTVKNVHVRKFETGICMVGISSFDKIYNNTVDDCTWGILLSGSSNSTIDGNMVFENSHNGIDLHDSACYNEISHNEMRDNGHVGIRLDYSSNYNNVFGNKMIGNTGGVAQYSSSNNNIYENNITSNDLWGIDVVEASNSKIYHNNVVGNPESAHIGGASYNNVWDDGYPSGGNYWSDYIGVDSYSGPYQNRTGRDGIGDTPYVIAVDNIDHYPIVTSFGGNVPSSDHMVVASSSGPLTLDPARCYDTASAELILNVYETLVFFDREKIEQFVPRLAVEWNISTDGLSYTFVVRQNVRFHNDEMLTTEDVEYSLERLLVIEGDGAWMFYEAFFDKFGSHDANGTLIITSQQIDDAITRTASTVTLHLAKPYPPLMQVLSLPWASILSKKWCMAKGDWPRTWENWTSYNKPAATAIEMQDAQPPGPRLNAMCGTGPFLLDYYSSGVEWSLIKYDDYWGGWPAPGCNGFVQRVTHKIIGNWENEKAGFLAGTLDSIYVPRTEIYDVLGQPGVRCIYPLPTLDCNVLFFTFNLSVSSPYLGVSGGLPLGMFYESGIPPDFFSDINVRKGFVCSINYSKLIDELLLGEGFQPSTPIIPGLPFYNLEQEKYGLNLTKAEEYLRLAWGGELWAQGFTMTICYSSLTRQKVCEMLKANIESLNAKFHVNIQSLPSVQYYASMEAHELPIFSQGLTADFADPHNFAYLFIHSSAFDPGYQRYSNTTVDTLVREGIATTDDRERKNIYFELQRIYHEDCPGVPLYQTRGRRFEREWVRGWFYNPLLYGSDYFYVQWKENAHPYELSPGENVINALSSSDTMVFMNTIASGNLSIVSTDINLEGTITEGIEVHYVKSVTVDTTIPHENIVFPIEMRVYFMNQEVISAYVGQSTLRMYYWNATSWSVENNSGVVTPSDIPGYAGYVWARIYHLSLFAPLGQPSRPDIAMMSIPLSKNSVGQGYTVPLKVTVQNQGNQSELFNVTVYANSTVIATLEGVRLGRGASANFSVCWDTAGFDKGNYTISANATTALGEIDIADNALSKGWILVSTPGDINADKKVNLKDVFAVALAFNSYPGHPKWSSKCDINNDYKVNLKDYFMTCVNFGKSW